MQIAWQSMMHTEVRNKGQTRHHFTTGMGSHFMYLPLFEALTPCDIHDNKQPFLMNLPSSEFTFTLYIPTTYWEFVVGALSQTDNNDMNNNNCLSNGKFCSPWLAINSSNIWLNLNSSFWWKVQFSIGPTLPHGVREGPE